MRGLMMLGQFLGDMKTQRLRTALTVMGIAWGTVAVVVLLAFGAGLERQMVKSARGIGDRVVIVFGGRTARTHGGFPEGRPIRLREADVLALAREIPEIRQFSPEYGTWNLPVRQGTQITTPMVAGVYPAFGEIRNVFAAPGGRFLNEPDEASRRRVAFLGDDLKRQLFGEEEAVGREIFIGRVPFTVVGVMESKTQNSSYGSRDQDRVFIPASTYAAVVGDRTLRNFVFNAWDPDQVPGIKTRIYETLGRRYTFDPADHEALSIWDTTEFERLFKYLFLGFNIFLGVVGSFTLAVGGIGVANIMYIVVRERTREIGVKRSLGARRRDILIQFLVEAALIVAVGATLGLLLSVGLVAAAAALPFDEYVGTATISPLVLGATLALLAAITMLAGFFPARRAAALDPVECLRHGG
jgi:putative ABC transport system permease protein